MRLYHGSLFGSLLLPGQLLGGAAARQVAIEVAGLQLWEALPQQQPKAAAHQSAVEVVEAAAGGPPSTMTTGSWNQKGCWGTGCWGCC